MDEDRYLFWSVVIGAVQVFAQFLLIVAWFVMTFRNRNRD